MSSNQTTILNAIETRVQAVLSADYNRLRYSYEVEKNDARTAEKAFGVGAGSATTTEGTNRAITLDQEFFVIITDKFNTRNKDNSERDALKNVYDQLEVVYRDLFQSKIGIPNSVLVVNELSLDEPVKIGDNVISVRMNFNVKHRKAT